MLGGDDKKSITICVFSFANGALFPLQLIFQRIMKQALPKTCQVERSKSWLSFYHD